MTVMMMMVGDGGNGDDDPDDGDDNRVGWWCIDSRGDGGDGGGDVDDHGAGDAYETCGNQWMEVVVVLKAGRKLFRSSTCGLLS